MKRVAVLTSGGDAPGMNAAIRAVVRTGSVQGWEMFGVQQGYAGLIAGNLIPLGPRDVGGIIGRGGTMLGSARCPEFRDEEVRKQALNKLSDRGIDALVVIGGNGSQTGAYALSQMGLPVVGVASTIDNDLYGSEMTIGVDTALNISLEAIDRLKVTAASHSRAFLVEVMGRDCGYLALMSGMAGGADAIVIPERELDVEEVALRINAAYERGKAHAVVVVAEGAKNNADQLGGYCHENRARFGFDLRVTKLGHVQRGGTPGAFDRLLASRLGASAIRFLAEDTHGVLVGLNKGEHTPTPLEEVVANKKPLDLRLLDMAQRLAY